MEVSALVKGFEACSTGKNTHSHTHTYLFFILDVLHDSGSVSLSLQSWAGEETDERTLNDSVFAE